MLQYRKWFEFEYGDCYVFSEFVEVALAGVDQDQAVGGKTEDFSVKAATKFDAGESFREGKYEVLALVTDIRRVPCFYPRLRRNTYFVRYVLLFH